MTQAYPLQWPPGWRRTEPSKRMRAKFNEVKQGQYGKRKDMLSMTSAVNHLQYELDRLCASNIIMSSNLKLRLDGRPYADQAMPKDPGVAVYFNRHGRAQCIPCDLWDRSEDNIRAIAKTIEALRGIERWGAKDMLDAAFNGFKALPDYSSGSGPKPQGIDYFAGCTTKEEIRAKFLQLVKVHHPDYGGDADKFAEVRRQYEALDK